MNFSWIDTVVVLAYLIGIGILGVYQAKKIAGSGDFFAGGRGFNKFMMMMHSLGTGTHADDPVAVTGAAFQRGISGIWYTFVYLFITPFYWIIAAVFRRARFITTTDFFEARFGPSLGILYTVMGIVTFIVSMGMMLKGTGAISQAVTQGAVPDWVAMLCMTVVFIIYGTAGGLIATVVTETIQGLLIVVMSLLLVPFGLMRVGGFAGLHKALDSSMFDLSTPLELSIPWILGASLMNLIGIVAQPHTMEVHSTGKTEWEGRIGATYGAMIKRFCAIGWTLTGLTVLAMISMGTLGELGHREEAFGTAIRVMLPAGFTGLMLAAVLAAQMSTLSAFMVASSALISRNIYKRWISPDAGDATIVSLARWAGLVVVVLGFIFAWVVPGVADAMTIFWTVTTFTGLFMWFGVLWRKTNSTGAWASFTVMVPIWLLFGPIGVKLGHLFPGVEWLGIYGDKAKLHLLLLAYLPPGLIALVIGSLFGKPMDKRKLDNFYMLLRTPVGQEHKLVEAGVDVVYAGHSKGHPWETKYPLLVNVLGFVVALIISLAFFALLYFLGNIAA
ncbi:MAG: sodium:solute symporter family protein [Armatimonadetes bacterium]|nr:sodium:solute symporter family protein [Armatimonadota bacterium]